MAKVDETTNLRHLNAKELWIARKAWIEDRDEPTAFRAKVRRASIMVTKINRELDRRGIRR